MNDSNIIHLNIHPVPRGKELTPIIIGRKYAVASSQLAQAKHGLCENFVFSDKEGEIKPASTNSKAIFLWDPDCELEPNAIEFTDGNDQQIAYESPSQLKTNRFTLNNHSISQPQIIQEDSFQQLQAQIDLNFVYTPDQFAARLGIITLVNTNCFLTLKDGKKVSLIDSDDEAVLYLEESHPADIVTPILETPQSTQAIEQRYSIALNIKLNNTSHGSDYETLSLFEQYTTYIMHRETPFSDNNIWTPVCAPIAWGWSMRTGFRKDGDGCIIRQKLLPPTLGHEGLEMPCWENNNLALIETA